MSNMVIDSQTANKVVVNSLEKYIDIVDPKIFTRIEDKSLKYYAIEVLEEKDNQRKTRILYINNRDYIDLLASGLKDSNIKVSNIVTNVKHNKISYLITYKLVPNHRRK